MKQDNLEPRLDHDAQPGWHFLQIPGPTNVPTAVVAELARPTTDHRSPDFASFVADLLAALQRVFLTTGPVLVFPSAGTGAWEAALTNVLSPGDRVLAFDTGYFARLWHRMAAELGFDPDVVEGSWRHGIDPEVVADRLRADSRHRIRAVMVVHNETSTGVASRVPEIRDAIDAAGHPALLLVDAVSSLGSLEYRHDAWGVDVTVASSQKGLMLPPGLGFNAISAKALDVAATGGSRRSYWNWQPILAANRDSQFPYTPAINLLFGLRKAIELLEDEGLESVIERHRRHAGAARAAVAEWGLELVPLDQRECSDTVTAIMLPDGHDPDTLRDLVRNRFNMSLGMGLGPLRDRVIRVGHLGSFNDLMLAGTLAGVEMGLTLAGVPIKRGGMLAALDGLMASA